MQASKTLFLSMLLIVFVSMVGYLGIKPVPDADAGEKASPDASFNFVVDNNTTQEEVNEYAWSAFLSLMWSLPGQPPGGDLRLWETWKEQYELYSDNGAAPAPWGSPQSIPAACKSDGAAAVKYLSRDEKVDDVLDAVNQAVKADGTLPGTLTDQNGNLVYYEIRLNKPVFDYVVDNRFYNGQVQSLADEIDFPDGSVIVKAAWKEITAGQASKTAQYFVTRNACICDEPNSCRAALTGLVGFHIMNKTATAPQWLWFTFEHLANVRPSHGLPASFNNPDCSGEYCAPNSQATTGIPNQITQLLPQSPELMRLNQEKEAALAQEGSVLSNYRLMSAQWPVKATSSGTPAGNQVATPSTVFTVQPSLSANTTMESFAQDTSSCMGCHSMSRSLNPDQYVAGDFSFTLNNANPKPKGAVCEEYDYSNSMSCSDRVILFSPEKLAAYPVKERELITLGYQLISHTYESKQTADYVGNRLHCRSCHLHGGGDPNASWWAGLRDKYSHVGLQNRINGCFERSMNGKKLCTTDKDCDSNQGMNAIMAYMSWINDEFNKDPFCDVKDDACPPHGFPALSASVTGKVEKGQAVFQQKCAFCHGADGQGRYGPGKKHYFRPALWGDDSYNEHAGMSNPAMLSRFLRSNMPYTSGGQLTDQEAQDIACFIDAQIRPGKSSAGVTDPTVCSMN